MVVGWLCLSYPIYCRRGPEVEGGVRVVMFARGEGGRVGGSEEQC